MIQAEKFEQIMCFANTDEYDINIRKHQSDSVIGGYLKLYDDFNTNQQIQDYMFRHGYDFVIGDISHCDQVTNIVIGFRYYDNDKNEHMISYDFDVRYNSLVEVIEEFLNHASEYRVSSMLSTYHNK